MRRPGRELVYNLATLPATRSALLTWHFAAGSRCLLSITWLALLYSASAIVLLRKSACRLGRRPVRSAWRLSHSVDWSAAEAYASSFSIDSSVMQCGCSRQNSGRFRCAVIQLNCRAQNRVLVVFPALAMS